MSNSSDSETNENIQGKVTKHFKKKVLEYLDIDDEIRDLRVKVKELTTEKKENEEFILNFLEQVGEKELATRDGTLRRNVYKTKAPLKKETMIESLTEITKDKVKSTKIVEQMMNNRPTVERVSLKRTKNRK